MNTVEHSAKYERVKFWYDMKMWSEKKVRNAVVMGFITDAEYTEITGNEY
ncbi:MAG: XkdX family protein [Clostridia bacterium]|nr:XkdX family protein [Clostridia bacterium]